MPEERVLGEVALCSSVEVPFKDMRMAGMETTVGRRSDDEDVFGPVVFAAWQYEETKSAFAGGRPMADLPGFSGSCIYPADDGASRRTCGAGIGLGSDLSSVGETYFSSST
jgi:hypothetical protein